MRFKSTTLVAILLIVFVSSEILFNKINNTSKLVDYCLLLSKYKPSSFFSPLLQNAIKVRLDRNSKKYTEYQYSSDSHMLRIQELETYANDDRKYSDIELPLLLYNLAFASYESGSEESFVDLLDKSILIDPDLSFSYIELSNYYYSKGQEEKGNKVLERCTSRIYPRAHCNNYINDREVNKYNANIGFIKESINDYFEKLIK